MPNLKLGGRPELKLEKIREDARRTKEGEQSGKGLEKTPKTDEGELIKEETGTHGKWCNWTRKSTS